MRLLVLALLFLPHASHGQEVYQDLKETVRAEVVSIVHEEMRDIIGTDTDALVQEVEVLIKEGARRGETVVFENDIMALKPGDSIYINRLETIDGIEYYMLKDADRRFALLSLGAVFTAMLLVFSGFHGLRALMSLALSVAIIFAVLVPLLLQGFSPVWVSVLVAGPILASTLFLTHGFTSRATLALLGTFGAVVCTGVLATVWVEMAKLTGLSSDEAIFLNFSTDGNLDFGGLLLGSIIIGILGILDDVAITQASVVQELRRANGALGMKDLYLRALRVGRDHIGSLVNTLALAYIGASLPLILLMVVASSSLTLSLNQEVVAVELIRIIIGSIGLVIAVPLTTLIAAWWYDRHPDAGLTHSHLHT